MKKYKTSRPLGPWLQLFLLLILLAGASAIGYLFRYLGFPETNIVIVYLLAVLIFSCFSSGYILGILASVLGTLAYNYFFTAPFFSLSVYDLSYLVTFAVMTAIALISSTLTARVRHNAAQARTRAMENEALYALTNHLTKAENKEAVAKIATEYISHSLSCDAVCLWNDSSAPACTGGTPSAGSRADAASHSEALSGHIPDPSDDSKNSGNFCQWPVTGQHGQLGVIRIPSAFAASMDSSQKRLLHSNRFLERKEAVVKRYELSEARPQWRENTNWAGLLIAVGNEYAPGNQKTLRQRQKTVEALCRQSEMAKAIASYLPEGLSTNKRLVAKLIRGGHFFLLTQMYRIKNRL